MNIYLKQYVEMKGEIQMKKWWLFTLLLIVLTLAACSNGETTESTATSKESNEDSRIIAGTVVLANILDRLELDAIAVPETAKELPARFDGLPTIGNAMQPDMEIIKSLNPTEVLSVTTLEYDLKDSFAALNIPVDFVDLTSIDSMLMEINEIGTRYNREAQAEALVGELEQKIADVQVEAAQQNKPSVLILLGVPGSYLVATENSYAGDLVRLAGGVNVMQGQEPEYLASNTEFLYNSNPDIIIRLAHGMPEQVIEMFDEEFVTNDIWKHFNAVKNGRVYDLQEDLFGTTAALNVPEALDQLMDVFYHQ